MLHMRDLSHNCYATLVTINETLLAS